MRLGVSDDGNRPAKSPPIKAVPGPKRKIRPCAVRADDARRRLQRAALHVGAAERDVAPADHRVAQPAVCKCRTPGSTAINQFQNQERNIEYVTLGPAQAGDIPQPTAESSETYFEAHKILFRAPEFRKIVTVSVTPADLAPWMQISDADVKAAYDERPQPLRHARAPAGRADRISQRRRSRRGGGEGQRRHELSPRSPPSAGLKDSDTDLGTVTEVGHHRSGGCGSRIRAQGR